MKATLRFNLDDYDDAAAFRRCAKATDAYIALFQIREGVTDLDALAVIVEALERYGIDLDDLS